MKAEDVLDVLSQEAQDTLIEQWRHPIEEFGAYFLSTRIQVTRQIGNALSFVKRHRNASNKVLLSDLIAALLFCSGDSIDLGGQTLSGGRFFKVSLGDTSVNSLQLVDCHFEYLDVTDAEPNGIMLSECTILRLSGMTSSEHAPAWLKDCLVEVYQTMATLSAIREAGLSIAQTFLLSSLRKLFLQPGGGRKQSSMYKGYGSSEAKKTCDKVIQLLVRNGFCEKYKGASEPLYVPDRALTNRVKAIMSQLTTSKDPLWQQVTKL